MPYERGQSAVIVPVSAVESLVSAWRRRFDLSAAHGVPAHVTVRYPFLHESRLDGEVLRQLGELCAATPALDVGFARLARFPHVLYLEPEPSDTFRRLTSAVAERWPEAPPSGGAYVDGIPHLTVAHDVEEAVFATIERDVAPRLPVRTRVEEAWPYVCDGEHWHPRIRLPFG